MTTHCLKIVSCILVLLTILISLDTSDAKKCHPHDLKVLLQIKRHFGNDVALSSWDPKADCCEWGPWDHSVTCGPSGRVIGVDLSAFDFRYLDGEFPPMLGDLPFLEEIRMPLSPNIRGPIPNTLTKLTNLSFISIVETKMNGTIPEFLSQIKSLTGIELSENNFSGPIPSSLSLLPNLNFLAIRNNLNNGSLPESFGEFKNNMSMDLLGNQLTGPIPKSWGKVKFTDLNLGYNNLTGDASFLFGKDKIFRDMILSTNQLSFNLSNIEVPLDIGTFEIDDNKIFGSFPEEFDRLEQLQRFNVSNNQLCGKVPDALIKRFVDPSSYANNKCLCGSRVLPRCP